jgi:hypothetical protein
MDSIEMEMALIIRRAAHWVDYFTPATFVTNDERDAYRLYVEDCFANERHPLWPNDWRHTHVTAINAIN